MNNKPVIGVIPLFDYNKNSYWMLPGYFGGITEAGGLPVMLPLTNDSADIQQITFMCDGFLFTGGQDVDPKLYSARKTGACGECSPERDLMEELLLKRAMEADKPILGICRGIQFINAALGGTLWQDIPSQFSDTITHCQKPPYDVPIHEVNVRADSPLYDLLKADTIPVNSYHHQGVRALSPELLSMAEAPDGLIEAVYAPNKKFIWAVSQRWKQPPYLQRICYSLLVYKVILET